MAAMQRSVICLALMMLTTSADAASDAPPTISMWLDFFTAWAWPLTIIALAVVFRPHVVALLSRIRQVGGLGVEAQFEALETASERLRTIIPSSSKGGVDDLAIRGESGDFNDHLVAVLDDQHRAIVRQILLAADAEGLRFPQPMARESFTVLMSQIDGLYGANGRLLRLFGLHEQMLSMLRPHPWALDWDIFRSTNSTGAVLLQVLNAIHDRRMRLLEQGSE